MPDPRLPASALDPHLASEPHDRCVRCGRPTPLGVSLCEYDNPGHIGAPSATQLHATMLAGVGVGVLGLALVARLMLAGVGPFDGRIVGQELQAGGGASIAVQVTNRGTRDAPATCQVSREGVKRPDDPIFLTQKISAGATVTLSQPIPPPAPGASPYILGELTVSCR
jgi:predicted nucleic acid-binding Zn ribbon protein